MNRNRWIALAVVVILAGVGLVAHFRASAETPEYRFVEVARGDVSKTVSATGTLGAVTTVSVGTQVSGQISDIYVDFNAHVRKGQLLARIDPKLAQQAITDAQAALDRSRAQLLLAQREHVRNRELLDAGLVARSAFDETQSAYSVAESNVKSAQVALDRARQNLAYTEIHAPIDGVVVERNVDVGQTVAASLSAPQLFLIANDLSQMQILVKVDESDIGVIEQGQQATFTVQALPKEKFHGTVEQVRLQSTVQENVVQYTVVVAVDNREGKLLPGMTASVDFLVQSAQNVLTVPNAALRFVPPNAVATNRTSTEGQPRPGNPQNGQRRSARNGGAANRGRLFYLDENGKLSVARIQTGISDGTVTEVSGGGIHEGMKVIAAMTQATAETAEAPFQQNQQQRRGPRGAF